MIRALIGVLIAAIAAAFIRGVIGMITREMGSMMNPEKGSAPPRADSGPAPSSPPPSGTALRKCRVCETYSPADRMIDGAYCSAACKENSNAA